MSVPLFEFEFLFIPTTSGGFYRPPSLYRRVTTTGATEQEAVRKALAVLGELSDGNRWTRELKEIREIHPAAGDTP